MAGAVALTLVGFIGYLLADNYIAHQGLRRDSLEDHRYYSEEVAAALGYFFSERVYDLNNLAVSRELATYFENRAVGMTMAYGLRASLVGVAERFDYIQKQTEYGGVPVYDRLVFVDVDGVRLADTSDGLTLTPEDQWLALVDEDSSETRFDVVGVGDDFDVLISIPCYFDGVRVGQLLGYIEGHCIALQMVDPRAAHQSRAMLLYEDRPFISDSGNSGDDEYSMELRENADKSICEPFVYEGLDNYGRLEEMVGVVVPVPSSPFYLVCRTRMSELVRGTAPWLAFMGMVALALVLVGGSFYAFRAMARNSILRTLLEEEEYHHLEVERKNEMLGIEIAERITAEQKLEQYSRNLESMVEERTAELRKVIDDLHRTQAQLVQSEKLAAIGHLASGIAHEINTPAQYVGDNARFLDEIFGQIAKLLNRQHDLLGNCENDCNAEAVVTEIKSMIDELDLEFLLQEVPDAIHQTLEGVGHVADIVLAMKEFSGSATEGPTPVDINQAIANTVTVTRNSWKKIAVMDVDYDPNLPLVWCCLGDFNQVMLNLISNACDAIEKAGNEPGIQGRIGVSTRYIADHGEVEIRVSDTGGGIAEDIRSHIFDPFFTTKEVGSGMGQGLYMVHSIISERHGGSIRFETELGVGSTFIVRLPLQHVVKS
ncbi:MAG: hypothetical protein JW936_08505 [Sedimentisphaerales bacterium]|nr:hypothetical protein [Sedimentisphaerales bacterium]